jgi:hypothetical protein
LKKLFSDNIYPKKNEFHTAMKKYLIRANPDFIGKFSPSRWIVFYENNIQKPVSLVE